MQRLFNIFFRRPCYKPQKVPEGVCERISGTAMCGIAGWIGRTEASPDPGALNAMTDSLAHRGPDGEGEFTGGSRDGKFRVGLGHRRLAIIDLTAGQQPMHAADGSATVVFNGEIYNFRDLREELRRAGRTFRTDSDTEVLLEAYLAWGPDCVKRLRGMFAFAIWDARRDELVLARDSFGKKPLYLFEADGVLFFASEIKAILAASNRRPSLDRGSVLDYLLYRYVPGPFTLFEGVVKLPPGSVGVWRAGEFSVSRFYDPPDGTVAPSFSGRDDPAETFLTALDDAVEARMISDVPFGAFLSGGLDSSAVVALMSRHGNGPVNTFSVGFAEAEYSELGHAETVARAFRTNHHPLEVSASTLMEHLPALIGFRDAPVAEPSDIPIYLISREAAKSVKMVLTGEGADEILAGYPKHRFEPLAAVYQSMVPRPVHGHLIEPLVRALPYRFRRIKTLAANMGIRDPQERLPRWFGALSCAERAALAPGLGEPREPDPRPFSASPGQSPLRRALYFDQTSWLPDNLLERGDRMSMAASIELRMPFLDTRLASLVATLPDSARLKGCTQKAILRQAMKGVLPDEILKRPKVGFRVPVNEWFRGTMQDYVREHLLGAASATRDLFDRRRLTEIVEEHASGRQNHEKLIWTFLNLELFQRRYGLA